MKGLVTVSAASACLLALLSAMACSSTPPSGAQAVINYYPGQAPGSTLVEGDFALFDCSASTGDLDSCHWELSGTSIAAVSQTSRYLSMPMPDKDPTLEVRLTISNGADQDSATLRLAVQNARPVLSLPDTEVVLGEEVSTWCRFADPGWQDTHKVEVTVDGNVVPSTVRQENVAGYSSGVATAVIDPAALSLGAGKHKLTCSVRDNGGARADASAALSVVPRAAVTAREGSEAAAGVRLRAGQIIAGTIDGPTDMDLYEIVAADGSPLASRAEVNVMVDVPGDYDAVLLSRLPADATPEGFSSAPFVNVPFVNVPFVNVPFVNVPFVNVPFVNVPFVNVPFVNVPFVNVPFANAPFVNVPLSTSPWLAANLGFTDLPLSQVGLAAPERATISGSDTSIDEYPGLDRARLEALGLRARALSGDRTGRREHMLIKVAPGEKDLFLAVFPSRPGLVYRESYQVSVEVATPPGQRRLLGKACEGEALVAAAHSTKSPVLYRNEDTPKTLIITQMERFAATQHTSVEKLKETLLKPMDPFFAHPTVDAKVVSLPSVWFDDADREPCLISEQNAAADRVAAYVQAQLKDHPSIEYVQILGASDVITHYFVPDEAEVGFEALYAAELAIEPASPLAVGIAEGYNLSDAPFVDADPVPYRGRLLYLEDVPVARLTESPEDIVAAAEAFVRINGELAVDDVLAFGYDFFIDGTVAAADAMDDVADVTLVANDNWTGAMLRDDFLGAPGAGTDFQVNLANGHATYFGMLSADGFNSGDYSDLFYSGEPLLRSDGETTLSIGCHSALAVPDSYALFPEIGTDWVQKHSSWVGPMTYGLGDTLVANRGSEGLATLISEAWVGGASLGNAVVQAKRQYALTTPTFDPHDEKSVIGMALFGMPQLTLAAGSRVSAVPRRSSGPSALAASRRAATAEAISGDLRQTKERDEPGKEQAEDQPKDQPEDQPKGQPKGQFTLNLLVDGEPLKSSADIALRRDETFGTWFTFNGEAEGSAGRPLQPLLRPVMRQVKADTPPIRDVVIRGGRFEDMLGVDPVFGTPTHDWARVEEVQACVESFTPSRIAVAARGTQGDLDYESVLINGGQFKCDDDADGVSGTLRLYRSLDLEVTTAKGTETDRDPPRIVSQSFSIDPKTGDVIARLSATARSGIREIVVLAYQDDDGRPGGPGTLRNVSRGSMDAKQQRYLLRIPDALDSQFVVQYVANDGSVTVSTAKGHFHDPVALDFSKSELRPGRALVELKILSLGAISNATLTLEGDPGEPPLRLTVLDSDGKPGPETTLDSSGVARVRATLPVGKERDSLDVKALLETPGGDATATLALTTAQRR